MALLDRHAVRAPRALHEHSPLRLRGRFNVGAAAADVLQLGRGRDTGRPCGRHARSGRTQLIATVHRLPNSLAFTSPQVQPGVRQSERSHAPPVVSNEAHTRTGTAGSSPENVCPFSGHSY